MMLSFNWPWAFALLALLPAVAYLHLRKRWPALRYPGAADVRASIDWPRWLDLLGWLLVFTLLIAAVAGPRTPDLRTRLPSQGIAVALVVDVSGSMASPLGSGTRLDAAKAAFASFVEKKPNDAIALVSFAAVPQTACPPTLNHEVLKGLISKLEPRSGIDAGTNIGDAVAEAVLRLRSGTAARKVIVLLTDGEHNAAGSEPDAPLTPRQAAQLAANLGIPLYAIDCGSHPEGDADAEKNREAVLKILDDCAALTGGKAFAVNDPDELQAAVRDIDRLEKSTLESFQYRRYTDHRWPLGLASMLLLALLSRGTS